MAKNMISVETELMDRLSFIEWKLDPAQRQIYIDVKRTNKELISFLKKKPIEINQPYTYELVAKNQTLMYKGLLDIVESRKELEDLRISFRQSSDFWEWRNIKKRQRIF